MSLAIFDLDNTLIDRATPFRRWATQFVTEHALDPDEVQWLIDADGDGYVPRAQFMSAVRERYGLHKPVDVLVNSYQEQIVALVDLDPRVPALLDGLREEGWRVAIATNGSTAQQSAKIRQTGLGDHVDAVAISEEVGVAKPDPRIFQAAAQRCGQSLAEGGWMIGDCPVRDVAGGQQVGLHTVWIRRARVWNSASRTPDAVVDHVVDAIAALSAPSPMP